MEPAELRRRFRNGGSLSDVAQSLGLGVETEDLAIAKHMVRLIADDAARRMSVERDRASSTGDIAPEAMELGLLGRLSTVSADPNARAETGVIRLDSIESVSTLVAIASGGSLFQRRAALRRLSALVKSGIADAGLEEIADHFGEERERTTELAAELNHLRAAFPGTRGREAREELASVQTLFVALERDIRAAWEADQAEPLRSLSSVDLARIAIHLRDASDLVVAHLLAVLEGYDGGADDFRATLLSALTHAGDTRLVPALIALLGSRNAPFVIDAARTLAHIDDARALPALRLAYDRSVNDVEKTVITGALGRHGDLRGAVYLRQILSSPSPKLLTPCLEALETMANREDLERLHQLLGNATHEVDRILATRVVGQLGVAEAAPWLDALISSSETSSALRAETEDALQSIEAQMALRGESLVREKKQARTLAPRAEGWLRRALARFDFALGNLNAFVNRRVSAIAYFQAAGDRDKSWALPFVVLGRLQTHEQRYADAIAAFREAMVRDRKFVESQRWCMKSVAVAFLERTESLLKEHEPEIARGILAELLDFDLRKVPSAHRFEARRKHALMRAHADRSESERQDSVMPKAGKP